MMLRFRFAKITFLSIILVGLFASSANSQDAKSLFNANCASCHAMDKKLTGPALMGAYERWGGDRKKLTAWIKNSTNFAKSDKYATDLIKEYSGSLMTSFEGALNDKEIDAIITYIKDWKPPVEGPKEEGAKEGSDSSLLYGILTLILAVVAFTLMQVNSNLKKLSDDKEGFLVPEPVPFYKNKAYIATAILGLVVVGGYLTAKGAIGLGRNQEYTPEQPIFYSHKVHAGINQINCLYCHGGAQEGKHANIPSVNVCMNCHMTINEYTGKDKLITADGKEVNGTAEIQKLYKYAGYTPGQPWDASKATPIEWVKIHNLPDHVYFNHSQHVKAGKVQCQTCHGEVTNMGEMKQFSDLSMGWCVNCHRESKVQFKENGFYSIYEKYHQQLKNGGLDSTKGITVEKIGGTECQKCHY